MTTWEARNSQPSLTSDIGVFVAKYRRLADLLSPFAGVGNAVLYVVRWRNYLLTLVVLVALSVLMYYPALLLGCVTLSAIVGMGLGRYYKQTHVHTLAKLKQPPTVEHLNQDEQILMRQRKEQKNSRKTLVEYRTIMQSAERFLVVATEILQYLNSIIFWKSPEVSLCVTLLLCVVFVLVCAVPLRNIASCLPVLALCSNRHFFKRTIEVWTIIWNVAYTRLKVLKWKRKKDNKQPTRENTQPHDGNKEVADSLASARDTATIQDNSTKSGTSSDSDDTRVRQKGDSRDDAQSSSGQGGSSSVGVSETNTAAGTAATGKGSASGTSKKELLKGFCTKCSVSFAKLLKRKHDCNYCGQSFCGSCTVKVKRALLGATSPTAFEESVRVCVDCKEKLDDLITQRPGAVR